MPIRVDDILKNKRFENIVEGIRFIYPPSFSVVGDATAGLKNTVIGKIKREFLDLVKAYGFKQVIFQEEYTRVSDYRALRDVILIDPVFRFSSMPVEIKDIAVVKVLFTYMLPYGSVKDYLKLYYSRVPKTKLLTHNIVVRGYVMIGYDAKRNVLVLPQVFVAPPHSKHVLIARNVLAYTRMLLESARNNTPLPLDQSAMSPLIRDTMLMLNLRPTRINIVIEGQKLFKHIHLNYAGNEVDIYNRDTSIEIVMRIDRVIKHVIRNNTLHEIHPDARWRGYLSLSIDKSNYSLMLSSDSYLVIRDHRIPHPNISGARVCTGSYSPYTDLKRLIEAGKGIVEAGLSVLSRVVDVLSIPNLDSAYNHVIEDYVRTYPVRSLDYSGISARRLARR